MLDGHNGSHGLLRVETAVAGTVVRVSAFGELDLGSVGSLEDPVRCALKRHHPSQLILDLRTLTFIDSSGLRLLLVLKADARFEGWRLTIVSGPERVRRTMDLAGVSNQLELVNDRAAANGDSSVAARRGQDVWPSGRVGQV